MVESQRYMHVYFSITKNIQNKDKKTTRKRHKMSRKWHKVRCLNVSLRCWRGGAPVILFPHISWAFNLSLNTFLPSWICPPSFSRKRRSWDSHLQQPHKLLSEFSSVSHTVSTAVKLPVPECFCKCWRRAMEMFVAACMLWVIQVTFSWPRCPAATEYLWAHQTPVWFITWHLSSCFISVNGLFPLSAPAAQRKKPEGYWLLFTNQPHIFFSPCTQSLVRFSFLFF